LFSSLHLLDGTSNLSFLVRFGVVTCLPAERDSARIVGMRKFAVGTFATPRNFVKSGCAKIVDKLSDFSWHFYRFNRECKLFDAERSG
jgi:hypothetical protein